ncbi:MAG: hypothetical protein K0S65_4659, partial [Labilithrix sp.]|nr:hypothetical protein [Labilithrix sp.]
RIDGIPVGKVTVNTSHPKIPGSETDPKGKKEVEIKDGVVVRVDLELVYHGPPDAGPPVDAGPPIRLH